MRTDRPGFLWTCKSKLIQSEKSRREISNEYLERSPHACKHLTQTQERLRRASLNMDMDMSAEGGGIAPRLCSQQAADSSLAAVIGCVNVV